MKASLYLYGFCIDSIQLDQIKVPHTKPGTTLSYDDIIRRKLKAPKARDELTALVRIHLDLPRRVHIRYTISKTSRLRWAAACYAGRGTYLCTVRIYITL